jgi:hypothetical protein
MVCRLFEGGPVTNIVVLNSQAHRTVRVQTRLAARYGDGQRFVPVIVGELAFLAVHYPVFFAKDSETGSFYCGAMLGIDEGENLFLNDEKGREPYRPLNLQRGPFFTAGSEIAIDLDHPRLEEGGQPLFTEAGEPTAYLSAVIDMFRDLAPGQEQTRAFIDTLLKLKLIEPIDINLAFDDGSRRQLDGLYTVNRDMLKNLPDATVVDLFRCGYLQAIYLMVGSLKQIAVLAQRKNARFAG